MARMYLKAEKEKKHSDFLDALHVFWNDCFSDPAKVIDRQHADFVKDNSAKWKTQIIEKELDDIKDWQEFMTIESDHELHCSKYFVFGKLGCHLYGYQYDLAVI
ncbi:hypothetical protein C0995_002447 [Termitomyces sp. Mi166|nr:hypothetical protein C0995_002447 [Termitomyces sp. Mi166\